MNKKLKMLLVILAVIGGINWATVGIFNLNLLTWLFGMITLLSDSMSTFLVRFLETVAGLSTVSLLWEKLF